MYVERADPWKQVIEIQYEYRIVPTFLILVLCSIFQRLFTEKYFQVMNMYISYGNYSICSPKKNPNCQLNEENETLSHTSKFENLYYKIQIYIIKYYLYYNIQNTCICESVF